MTCGCTFAKGEKEENAKQWALDLLYLTILPLSFLSTLSCSSYRALEAIRKHRFEKNGGPWKSSPPNAAFPTIWKLV
jgi:hypothetical protein